MDGERPGIGETLKAIGAVTAAAWLLALRGVNRAAGPFLPYDTTRREAPPFAEQEPTEDLARLNRRYLALLRTHRFPWSTCLTRSLALCRYARATCGFTPRLNFGTRREGDAVAAHAWVSRGKYDWGRDGHEAMTAPPTGSRQKESSDGSTRGTPRGE